MECGVRAAAEARLDVSGVPEAKTIGFSESPQGCINLALDLALFLKLSLQDRSQVLLFERLFAMHAMPVMHGMQGLMSWSLLGSTGFFKSLTDLLAGGQFFCAVWL